MIGCSFSEIVRREDFRFSSSLLSDCVCSVRVHTVRKRWLVQSRTCMPDTYMKDHIQFVVVLDNM